MTGSLRVVGSRLRLAASVFRVEERTVTDGAATFARDVVVHEGAVAVMAVREDGRVGVLRQYRATFDDVAWELPAGTRDVPGEDPRDTASRELAEEMGCHAATVVELYRYMNSRGWSTQTTIVYEARDLTFSDRQPDGPEETASEVHWLDADELRAIIAAGQVVEASTLIAIIHRLARGA